VPVVALEVRLVDDAWPLMIRCVAIEHLGHSAAFRCRNRPQMPMPGRVATAMNVRGVTGRAVRDSEAAQFREAPSSGSSEGRALTSARCHVCDVAEAPVTDIGDGGVG
jgi:hypothetical protein